MISGRVVGLRAVEREDLPLLRDWRNMEWMRRFCREYRELNMASQEQWLAAMNASQRHLMFVIVDRVDGTALGVCGLTNICWIARSAEVSIYIGADGRYIDETLAPDALNALLQYAFRTLGMHKAWAEVYAFDHSKIALFADRFGFNRDGVLRDNVFADGRHHDSVIFSLLSQEFEAQGRAAAGASAPD